MKKLILSLAFLILLADGARAGVVLSTGNPPGSPLIMGAGTTSGPMLVDVASDNAPNDIMSAWQVTLQIVPEAGATGTLTFQDPATATPPNPPGYIFGDNGMGIWAANMGSTLNANDFFNGAGVSVSGSPGASLLQMDFLASSDASGSFGIYAVEGAANTQWTDSNPVNQLFTNVPDGSGLVQIGEVLIGQSVPEPSSAGLLGLAGAVLAGWEYRKRRKHAQV